jgi:serine/threonine protein kinase/tetratricopeptide (TPR) repeat protein
MVDKIISHYKLLEKIGEGGMGVIYKAEDTRLKRIVALKLLPPELTRDPDTKIRFIHEAQAASKLEHPNICTVFEIDETEDGQCFISMSYCAGITLKSKIEQKPLDIKEAIDIAIQIAQGLDKAHKNGIVHRDIKPANIMITDDGMVKIVDFGLAKLTAQTKLTKEGITLGTIAYMSPEQARGEAVNHQTDTWSLGVVLYEMITGQLPYKGEYEKAIIYSIINEDPQPLTALRSGVPLELERVINKCLEKKPSDRYQHVDELIVDLHMIERVCESKSKPFKKEYEKAPATKTPFNYKRVLIGIIFICLIITSGFFIIKQIFKQPQTEMIKSIAVLPFTDLSPDRDQEYFCDGMTEQLTTNLSRLQKLRVRGRNSVMQFKNTTKTIPQIARELKVDYVMEGSIRKVASRVRVTVQLIKAADDYHVWANDYDRELDDILNVQDDIAKTVTGILLTKLSGAEEEKIKTKRPINTEVYEYYIKGKYYHYPKFFNSLDLADFAASEKMLLKAIELDSNYTPAYIELADLYNTYYFVKANTAEEDKYMKLQEQFLQKAFRLDSTSAEADRVRGSIYLAKGEEEKAYQYFKKSVELDINNIDSNSEFGYFLITKGLYDHAIKYFLRVIETDPLDLGAYQRIATAYWNTGQLEQAENYYRKVLEIDPNLTVNLYYYARILFDMKKYDRFNETRLKLEKIDTNSVHLKYLQSLQYILKGEKERALKTYSKPDRSREADFLIMRLYDHFGMYNDFIKYLHEDFARLEKLEESWYLWLKNATLFDALRPYPGFQEILEKHKQLYEENLKKYKDID